MADFRQFKEFDSKRPDDWTSEIDLTKFDKMQKAFKTLIQSARDLQKNLDMNMPLEEAISLLKDLEANGKLVAKRYNEMTASAFKYNSEANQAKSAGKKDEAAQLYKKAKAAESYSSKLRSLMFIYRDMHYDFSIDGKHADEAADAIAKEISDRLNAKEPVSIKAEVDEQKAKQQSEKATDGLKERIAVVKPEVDEQGIRDVETKLEDLSEKVNENTENIKPQIAETPKEETLFQDAKAEERVVTINTEIDAQSEASIEQKIESLRQKIEEPASIIIDNSREQETVPVEIEPDQNSMISTAEQVQALIASFLTPPDTEQYNELAEKAEEYRQKLEEIKQQREAFVSSAQENGTQVDPIQLGQFDKDSESAQKQIDSLEKAMERLEKKAGGLNLNHPFEDFEAAVKVLPAVISQMKLNLVDSEDIEGDLKQIKILENAYKKINDVVTSVQKARAEQNVMQYQASSFGQDGKPSPTTTNTSATTVSEPSKETEEKYNALYAPVDVSWIAEANMGIEELIAKHKELDAERKKLSGSPIELMPIEQVQQLNVVNAEMREVNRLIDDFANKKGVSLLPEKEGAGGGEQEINSLQELKDAIDETKAELDALRESAQSGDIADFDGTVEEARELEERLKKLESMRLALEGKAPKTADFTADIKNYEDLKAKIKAVSEERDQLATKVISGDSSDIDEDVKKLHEYEAELKALNSMKSYVDSSAPQPEVSGYKDLVKQIKTITKEKENLRSNIISGKSTDLEGDTAKLQEYEQRLKALRDMQSKVTGKRSTSMDVNPEIQQRMTLLGLIGRTISLNAKLAGQKTKLPFSSDIQETQSKIYSLQGSLRALNSIWSSMSGGLIVKAFQNIGSAAKNLAGSLGSNMWNGVKSGAQGLMSVLGNLSRNGFQALKTGAASAMVGLKKLASGGFNAVKNGINGFKSGIKTVSSHMTNLSKRVTPNLTKTLSSFKSMLMRRIKRTFISSIFNEAKASLQNLAKVDSEFNSSMSNLKNSATQLSGNVAVSIGNLVNAVAPVIETLIGYINSAVVAFNNLWAVISGKNTVTVAKKGTDNYAKSLGKASSSAKDLNHQLYGFDEITKQEDNSGSGSSGSGASFGQQQVTEAASALGDLLKNGQFFEAGQMIGEALDGIVNSINDWFVEVRPMATQWAANIAELLNGIVDTDLFSDMGTMIGNGLNLVFDVADTFLEAFDWGNLGTKLAQGVNNLFGTVDWDLVGATFANGYNAIFETLSNFFATLDWQSIGYDLATGLSSFFSSINWDAWKLMWTSGINGVIELLYTFIDGVDWDTISHTFFTNVNDIINGIDWDNLASLVSTGIDSVIDMFWNFVDSDIFDSIATNFGTTVGSILDKINWTELATSVVTGLFKIRKNFWKFIELVNFPNLASKIATAINDLFTDQNVLSAWDASNTQIVNSINSIIDAFGKLVDPDEGINFAEIGTQIGTHVTELFQGINWEELATNIGLGVSGIVEAFGNLLTGLDLPNVAIKIANGVNALFDPQQGGAKFDDAISAVSNGVNGLIEGFANLIDPENGINFASITSTISDKVNHLIQATDWATLLSTIVGLKVDLYNSFFQAIGEVDWETLGSKIGDAVNNLFTEERLASLGENIGNAVAGVLEGITSLISGIDWGKVGEGIITFIKNIDWGAVLTSILELLTAAVSGVGSLISGLFNAIFGGGENVEVPQILSDDMMEQLRQQMGAAGEELAGYLQDSLARSLEGAGTEYESAKQLFIDSITMIGTGAQEEWEETLSNLNVPEERIALLAEQVGDLFSVIEMPDATANEIREAFKANGIWITNGLAESLVGQGKEDVARAMQLLGMGVDEETIRMLDLTNLNANLTAYMNESKKDITTIAKELGSEVGDGLGFTIPDAVAKALGIGTEEVKRVKGEMVQEATASTEEIAEAESQSSELGEKAAGAVATAEEEKIGDVEESTGKVTSAVTEKYEALPEEVKPYAEKLMEYIVTALENKDGTVKAAIESVAQAAVDRAKEILAGDAGVEIAKGFIDGMISGFNEKKTDGTLKTGAEGVVKAAVDHAKDMFKEDDGKKFAKAFVDGLKKGFTDNQESLVTQAETTANDTVSFFKTELDKEKGTEYATNFTTGISTGFRNENNSLQSEVGYVAQDIIDTISEKANYSEGSELAYYIMQGLIDGLENNRNTVSQVAWRIANDLVTTMEERLRIGSPSKVFEQIGDFTMMGLQNGLEGQETTVLNTIGNIANSVIDEAQNAGDIEMNVGTMTNGLDTVADKMERIASIFEGIANTITQMGGLEIPTVASGKVLPYRTKVGDTTSVESPLIDGNALESTLYSAIRRALGSTNAEQEVNITLSIDGRKLTDIVTKYQRQQDRAWSV